MRGAGIHVLPTRLITPVERKGDEARKGRSLGFVSLQVTP